MIKKNVQVKRFLNNKHTNKQRDFDLYIEFGKEIR